MSRKFLIDASMPRSLGVKLQELGFEVVDIRDIAPPHTPDSVVYAIAQAEKRIIVTHDLGFANIIVYPPGSHSGIIVLRVKDLAPAATVKLVCDFVRSTAQELEGAFWKDTGLG